MTDRPLTAVEQTRCERFRALLQPTADAFERGAENARLASHSRPVPRSPAGARAAVAQRKLERRRYKQAARQALWKQAATTAPPCGFGVIELWLLNLVIGQLLQWILRRWTDADEDDHAA